MPRLTPAFVTALALAFLVVCVASPQAAAKEEKVKVEVKCRAKDDGPTKVTVDPWLVKIKEGDMIRWNLDITDSGNNTIVVSAKDGKPWPYEKRKHEGKKETSTKVWTGGNGPEYDYNITVSCNAYEFVIDPRVRVGP